MLTCIYVLIHVYFVYFIGMFSWCGGVTPGEGDGGGGRVVLVFHYYFN